MASQSLRAPTPGTNYGAQPGSNSLLSPDLGRLYIYHSPWVSSLNSAGLAVIGPLLIAMLSFHMRGNSRKQHTVLVCTSSLE